jgi:hypothetical protein
MTREYIEQNKKLRGTVAKLDLEKEELERRLKVTNIRIRELEAEVRILKTLHKEPLSDRDDLDGTGGMAFTSEGKVK